MRTVLIVGAIAFVGVAFVVFSVSRGSSLLSQFMLVAAAGVLTFLVLSIASVRGQRTGRRAPIRREPSDGRRSPPTEPVKESPHLLLLENENESSVPAIDGVLEETPRRLVEAYVPFPTLPAWPLTALSRRHAIHALKEEGKGLLRLAEGFNMDLSAYRGWVEDARRAALQGEYDAPLRSIKLANELLRGAVEKEIAKRDKMRQQELEQ